MEREHRCLPGNWSHKPVWASQANHNMLSPLPSTACSTLLWKLEITMNCFQVLHLLDGEPNCCVTRIMLDNMAKYDAALPGEHTVKMQKQIVATHDADRWHLDCTLQQRVTVDSSSKLEPLMCLL